MDMRIFAILIVLAGIAAAQPAFEVASVKPDASEIGVDRIDISKGSLIIQNVSLRRLINMAYGIPDSREYLLAGPDWLDSERFDISAHWQHTPKAPLSPCPTSRIRDQEDAVRSPDRVPAAN